MSAIKNINSIDHILEAVRDAEYAVKVDKGLKGLPSFDALAKSSVINSKQAKEQFYKQAGESDRGSPPEKVSSMRRLSTMMKMNLSQTRDQTGRRDVIGKGNLLGNRRQIKAIERAKKRMSPAKHRNWEGGLRSPEHKHHASFRLTAADQMAKMKFLSRFDSVPHPEENIHQQHYDDAVNFEHKFGLRQKMRMPAASKRDRDVLKGPHPVPFRNIDTQDVRGKRQKSRNRKKKEGQRSPRKDGNERVKKGLSGANRLLAASRRVMKMNKTTKALASFSTMKKLTNSEAVEEKDAGGSLHDRFAAVSVHVHHEGEEELDEDTLLQHLEYLDIKLQHVRGRKLSGPEVDESEAEVAGDEKSDGEEEEEEEEESDDEDASTFDDLTLEQQKLFMLTLHPRQQELLRKTLAGPQQHVDLLLPPEEKNDTVESVPPTEANSPGVPGPELGRATDIARLLEGRDIDLRESLHSFQEKRQRRHTAHAIGFRTRKMGPRSITKTTGIAAPPMPPPPEESGEGEGQHQHHHVLPPPAPPESGSESESPALPPLPPPHPDDPPLPPLQEESSDEDNEDDTPLPPRFSSIDFGRPSAPKSLPLPPMGPPDAPPPPLPPPLLEGDVGEDLPDPPMLPPPGPPPGMNEVFDMPPPQFRNSVIPPPPPGMI
jgi:hypothetical protein